MAKTPKLDAAAAPKVTRMKVRATRMGYYDHKRRRDGDVFVFTLPDGQDLPHWVDEVAKGTAVKETGAQAALTAQIDNDRPSKTEAESGDDLGI